jgi:hypothetical protein
MLLIYLTLNHIPWCVPLSHALVMGQMGQSVMAITVDLPPFSLACIRATLDLLIPISEAMSRTDILACDMSSTCSANGRNGILSCNRATGRKMKFLTIFSVGIPLAGCATGAQLEGNGIDQVAADTASEAKQCENAVLLGARFSSLLSKLPPRDSRDSPSMEILSNSNVPTAGEARLLIAFTTQCSLAVRRSLKAQAALYRGPKQTTDMLG